MSASIRNLWASLHGRRGFVLAATVLFLALGLPTAFAGIKSGLSSGGGNGNTDEGVGTLPAMWGGPGLPSAMAGWVQLTDGGAPNVYVSGRREHVLRSIGGAWGKGFASIDYDRSSDSMTIWFHGNVSVLLDRLLVERGAVVVGVWLSPSFQEVLAGLEWNGAWSRPATWTGRSALPLARLSWAGALDQAGVALTVLSIPSGGSYHLSAQSSGGQLLLSQTAN